MASAEMPPREGSTSSTKQPARLRLYVARSTPNSVRAEGNLSVVLGSLQDDVAPPILEVIDVFVEPKRAMTDCVVVTPTLIVLGSAKRVILMGDLADHVHVRRVIEDAASSEP